MKGTLYSTLAIVLAVLAATVTLSNRLGAEACRTRNALAKAQAVQAGGPASDEIAQKLDAITSQLATLNGRVLRIESAAAAARSDATPPSDRTPELSGLSSDVRNLKASLARLDGVPPYLAQLTTFLDQSFEHVEKTVRVTNTSATDALNEPLTLISRRLDAIDSSFTPLYSALGLDYDSATDTANSDYPALNERVDTLFFELDALRLDVARIRDHLDHFFAPRR